MWGNLKRLSQVVAPPVDGGDEDDEYDDDEDEDVDSQVENDDDYEYDNEVEEYNSSREKRFGLVGFLARALDQQTDDKYDEEESAEEEIIDLDYPSQGLNTEQSIFVQDDDGYESKDIDHKTGIGSPKALSIKFEPSNEDASDEPLPDLPPLIRESGSISPRPQSNLFRLIDTTDILKSNKYLTPSLASNSSSNDASIGHGPSSYIARKQTQDVDKPMTDKTSEETTTENIFTNNSEVALLPLNNQTLEEINKQEIDSINDTPLLSSLSKNNIEKELLVGEKPLTENDVATSYIESPHPSSVKEDKRPEVQRLLSSNSASSWQSTPIRSNSVGRSISDRVILDDNDKTHNNINIVKELEIPAPHVDIGQSHFDSLDKVGENVVVPLAPRQSSPAIEGVSDVILDGTIALDTSDSVDEVTPNASSAVETESTQSLKYESRRGEEMNHSEVDNSHSDSNGADKHIDSSELYGVNDQNEQIFNLTKKCESLQKQLQQTEYHVLELQQQARDRMDREEQQIMNQKTLEKRMADWSQEKAALLQELQKSQLQAQKAQEKLQIASQKEQLAMQELKRRDRSLQIAEDKLAHTMAMVDERDERLVGLQSKIETLQSTMKEHHHGAQEAEEELDELHAENESLNQHVEDLEKTNKLLNAEVQKLKRDSDKLSRVKLEMQMLKEDLDREKLKNQTLSVSVQTNNNQLETERDAALVEIRDLKHQLKISAADLEVARADTARTLTANENLQFALEAFQQEREAELAMLEQQRRENEENAARAQAAALDALNEVNEARIREIQYASDEAIKVVKQEMMKLQGKVEKYRTENVQMRRSLDEAIKRLQNNQEDIIDRSLMKNILLDWLTKNGTKEKRQVLEVMASLLHFTDEEKERVHISSDGFALGKVVGSVVGPLPPSRADVEHLQGDNVRDKWVNFLLAETED